MSDGMVHCFNVSPPSSSLVAPHSTANHLWSFLACKPLLLLPHVLHQPRDGVRRLDIVNDMLYIVSQHGYVDIFKFFPGYHQNTNNQLQHDDIGEPILVRKRSSFLFSSSSSSSSLSSSNRSTDLNKFHSQSVDSNTTAFLRNTSNANANGSGSSGSSCSSGSGNSDNESTSNITASTSLIKMTTTTTTSQTTSSSETQHLLSSLIVSSSPTLSTISSSPQNVPINSILSDTEVSNDIIPLKTSSVPLLKSNSSPLFSPIRTGKGPCSTLRPMDLHDPSISS
jgi:hypothetical protein